LAQQLNELDYKVLKRKPPTVEEFRTLPSEIISPFVWVDPLNTPGHQPWPRARIPYTIDASVTDATLLAAIKQAAAEWNRLGVMEVKPTAEFSPSEILGMQPLTIYSTSVLKDDNGRPVDPNVFSCFTYIGYDSRSSGPNFHGNYMYLSNKCKPWSVAHELGHALGLRHEHARTDRDAFINANLQLVGTKHRGDYQKQDGQGLGVSYDPCSIMHYKDTVSKDWSTTGQQEIWFTLKPPGQAALDTCRAAMDQECSRHAPGQRCGFSPSDIEVVRRLYQ
jgi:hypothetical protein